MSNYPLLLPVDPKTGGTNFGSLVFRCVANTSITRRKTNRWGILPNGSVYPLGKTDVAETGNLP